MPNAQLAQRILDQITAEPEHFAMFDWFTGYEETFLPSDDVTGCGTTMCVAGWACHMEGFAIISTVDSTQVRAPGGEPQPIAATARDLLGLPDDRLFYTNDDVAIEVLRQLAAGHEPNFDAAYAAAERAAELATEAEATAN